MNRTELVAAAASASGLPQGTVDTALKAVQDAITAAISRGEKVALPGFLTLDVAQRAARTGRNPRTGEELRIPARTVVRVTAGQALKRAADGS
jgi:DNA-binding protein HU-beta